MQQRQHPALSNLPPDLVPDDERTLPAYRVVRREPHWPAWYGANLARAYYLAGRYHEALAYLHDTGWQFPQQLAAVYVRLGRINEARAVIAEWRQANPRASIAAEAVYWPMRRDLKQAWLDDLRAAGVPER